MQGKKKGRPNKRWLDSVRADLIEKGLYEGEGEEVHDIPVWETNVIELQPNAQPPLTPLGARVISKKSSCKRTPLTHHV